MRSHVTISIQLIRWYAASLINKFRSTGWRGTRCIIWAEIIRGCEWETAVQSRDWERATVLPRESLLIDCARTHTHTHTHTRTDSAIRVPSPSASPLSSTDTAYRAHTSKTHFTMSSWHAARCCSNRLLIIANECGTSWVVITTAIRRPFESGFELSTSIIDHATTTVRLMLRP